MSKVESQTKTASKKRQNSLTLPEYRRFKKKDKAGNVVKEYGIVNVGPRNNRKRIYFGEYSTDKNSESQKEYRKWCIQYLENEGKGPPTVDKNTMLTIEDIIFKYLEYAEKKYETQPKTVNHMARQSSER